MALAKFGAIVTDVRGKLGGHVFQGNGFTTSLRTSSRTKGTIGKHNRTEIIGSKTSIEAHNVVRAEWAALSDAEKAQWSVLSTQFLVPNKFGDYVQLSGFALFTRNITALYYTQQSTSVDPFAASNVVPSVTLTGVEIDISGETVTYTYPDPGFSMGKLIYAQRVNSVNQRIQTKRLIFLEGRPLSSFIPSISYIRLLNRFRGLEGGEPMQFGLVIVNAFGFYTFKKTVYATYA